jgi:hypothetical protein
VPLPPSVKFAVIAACLSAASTRALAEQRADLCSPPKMQTDKWPGSEHVAGATILLPPGFHGTGNSSGLPNEKYFVSGRHREIGIGVGSHPMSGTTTTSGVERLPAGITASAPSDAGGQTTQLSSCTTTIDGRQVEITLTSWTLVDRSLSNSSDAGAYYRIVARFLPAGSQREMFVSFQTDNRSEISQYRQLFWTVTFDGSPARATACAPPPCVAKPDPSFPTADAVLDTALVQTLIASAGPAPHGFVVMALEFDPSGALAGITVAQSDLPDPAQRQLATLVASNLKPHDARTAASYMLRIDAGDAGLRYATQPACAP